MAFLSSSNNAEKQYNEAEAIQEEQDFPDDDSSLWNQSLMGIDKTGYTLTALTISKSYIGVGCLAIPYGFNECGY